MVLMTVLFGKHEKAEISFCYYEKQNLVCSSWSIDVKSPAVEGSLSAALFIVGKPIIIQNIVWPLVGGPLKCCIKLKNSCVDWL